MEAAWWPQREEALEGPGSEGVGTGHSPPCPRRPSGRRKEDGGRRSEEGGGRADAGME